ncbi:AprI/Inh family metalloprotease inhibitor [Bosea sp. BK604]|uniref:AprI/Inh family metalloprotease inhibitor n=1 Tax=Bosea sp. BK604 TaxID=2512180 RepID=UPI0014043A10|nr:AprI/Inh family metalloprotease inhibitor [Bosea sp. BK604]
MDEEGLNQRRARVMRRCLSLLIMGLAASIAQAQTPPLPRGAATAPDQIRPLVGAWDIEQLGAPRKCTITLGVETAANGRQVRFPATCHRALPILGRVASWSVAPGGLPQLNDDAGKPLIVFARSKPNADIEGKGTDGQQYALSSKDHPRAPARPVQSAAERSATLAARPTAVDPASAPAADSLPGRYSVMRQANREACRLTLSGPPDASGRAPAGFDGRCDDTGLTIFDPAGWRYAAGRLTLIARRGHSVELIFENGQWRKDPAVGAPLLMRKLAQ